MKRLTILFDGACTLCTRCRNWLARQPAWVPLEFLPLQDLAVPLRFPGIERFQPARQLVAVSDRGAVYVGDHAWIMCLWALCEYRAWALRLARPALRPLARAVCEAVSKNRYGLSRALGRLFQAPLRDADLARELKPEVAAATPPPLPGTPPPILP